MNNNNCINPGQTVAGVTLCKDTNMPELPEPERAKIKDPLADIKPDPVQRVDSEATETEATADTFEKKDSPPKKSAPPTFVK